MLIACALFAAAAAHADTDNVKKAKSQLDLRSANASANASGGATVDEKQAMFRRLDIDGDGFVSKAEAAGNAPVTLGFDRADRNRDGKLSFAEYDSIGRPVAKKSSSNKQAKGQGSASTGGTQGKKN
jgi:hypothetical protein